MVSNAPNDLRAGAAAPRRRLNPEERRNELIEVGRQMFSKLHYDDVKMEEVAERAGVSRALLYRYFADKRTLFTAVIQAEFDALYTATASIDSDPELSGFERVKRALLVYFQYQDENPHVPISVLQMIEAADPTATAIEQREHGKQTDRIVTVLRAVAGDELTADLEARMRVVIRAWLAFNHELARHHASNPNSESEWLAETSAHAMIDAARRIPGLPSSLLDFFGTQ